SFVKAGTSRNSIEAYNFYYDCLEELTSKDRLQAQVLQVDSPQVNLAVTKDDVSNSALAKKATKLDKTQVNLKMIKSHINIYSPAKKAMKDVDIAFSKLLNQDGNLPPLRTDSSRLTVLAEYINKLLELKKYPSMNKEI